MNSSDPFSFARDEFSTEVCDALRNQDFEAVEGFRDGPVADYLSDLVATYRELPDWATKDLVIHLIQDCEDDRTRDVMLDALESPNVESRAIAVSSLESDFAMFNSFVANGWVDAGMVDEAIRRFRAAGN